MVAYTRKDPPAENFNPSTDPAKTLEQYKIGMPGLAVATFVDARRKDVAIWATPWKGATIPRGLRGQARKGTSVKRSRS